LKRILLLGTVWFCLAGSMAAWSQDAVVEALGQATLAVETDNTRLNLFNLGNIAGAAFLPLKNRVDLALSLAPRVRVAEFDTGADGSPANVDPFGNTLTPATVYTRAARTWSGALNEGLPGGYGGALLALNDAVTLQILPRGSAAQRTSSDASNNYREQSGGGAVRGAWLADPHWAWGAGVSGSSAWERGRQSLDYTTQITDLPFSLAEYQRSQTAFGAELGGVWRNEAVFDAKDYLDLGLTASGERRQTQTTLFESAWGNPAANTQFTGVTEPWQARFQGVYFYQSVMDVALVAGYENQTWFRALAQDGLPGEPQHKDMALDNIDYELSFRVRLPMVRNDDLRFGVAFNNRGYDHPFPTGRLLQYAPDGVYSQPVINTMSSSIGIGMAFVPAEASIITLEYHLGSSKSRQDQPADALPGSEIIANSGFTRITFGAQYSLIENLVLRLGFSSLRVSYQKNGTTLDSNGRLVTFADYIETAGLTFGLGLTEGPLTFDLTIKGERILNSPRGWTMLDRPVLAGDASADSDQNLTTLLGVTWRMP
jgi:hypothetical protein